MAIFIYLCFPMFSKTSVNSNLNIDYCRTGPYNISDLYGIQVQVTQKRMTSDIFCNAFFSLSNFHRYTSNTQIFKFM